MKLFEGCTAVITGGSAGLGLALARTFLEAGAFVYLLARDADKLSVACQGLQQDFSAVASLQADVTRQAEVDAAFAEVRSARGQLDILVNAAGISHRAAVLETSPEDFQSLWELNFLGTVRCTRAAAADLLSTRGHLINIGSLASKLASAYLGAYPASKFAVAAYSQQLRLELGPRGLHVLLVCPGPLRRDDAGHRYDHQAARLPEAARRPGGGAHLKQIDPQHLGQRILRACKRREAELVLPAKVRWLAAITQISPRWGDWILRRNTASERTR